MIIHFKNDKEKRFYESEKQLIKKHGLNRARKIQRKIKQLIASNSIGEFFAINPRCHLLDHNYKGCFPIDLDGPYRLIIRIICEENVDFSRLDLFGMNEVEIVEVKNYHGN